MMDYSEILSRLVVFLGAGLPVRKAWAKIVEDYRRTEEKAGKRAAYEEMAAAYYLMQRGVPEIQAYSEFGNRCRVLPYRKLAGILEQNVKNGSKSLTPVLEAEMEAAFEPVSYTHLDVYKRQPSGCSGQNRRLCTSSGTVKIPGSHKCHGKRRNHVRYG